MEGKGERGGRELNHEFTVAKEELKIQTHEGKGFNFWSVERVARI